MFSTVLNYICLRIFGEEEDHDGIKSACAMARKWILDHGGATYTPLLGKAWLSVFTTLYLWGYIFSKSLIINLLILIATYK